MGGDFHQRSSLRGCLGNTCLTCSSCPRLRLAGAGGINCHDNHHACLCTLARQPSWPCSKPSLLHAVSGPARAVVRTKAANVGSAIRFAADYVEGLDARGNRFAHACPRCAVWVRSKGMRAPNRWRIVRRGPVAPFVGDRVPRGQSPLGQRKGADISVSPRLSINRFGLTVQAPIVAVVASPYIHFQPALADAFFAIPHTPPIGDVSPIQTIIEHVFTRRNHPHRQSRFDSEKSGDGKGHNHQKCSSSDFLHCRIFSIRSGFVCSMKSLRAMKALAAKSGAWRALSTAFETAGFSANICSSVKPREAISCFKSSSA